MSEPKKPGYYWAKANFVEERNQRWEVVEVRDFEVWAFKSEVPFDLSDFIFGPGVTKPEELE